MFPQQELLDMLLSLYDLLFLPNVSHVVVKGH